MGHVRAGQVLGRMYFLGAGIDRDREKAVDLYRKAAERGDAYALHSLGMAEIKGEGTAQNEKDGLDKLLQSVEAGHTFSFNAIGGFYLNGQHVEETSTAPFITTIARHRGTTFMLCIRLVGRDQG